MEIIKLGRDSMGKLTYTTSRGGKMYDITKEIRAKAINLEEMTKYLKPVFKSLYIIRHKVIVPMARIEDNDIDLIYINNHTKHAIFVPPSAKVTWNGKKI